jgi:hypothetical protein
LYNDAAPDGALLAPAANAKTDGQIISTGSE